jgi:hypothetical protein
MSLQSEIAFAHRADLLRISGLLAKRVAALWSQMDINNLDGSWARVAPQLTRLVGAAQFAAAELTPAYIAALDRSYSFVPPPTRIVPQAFTNVMGDGREVAPALYGAVTTTKELIGKGVPAANAFQSGASFLSIIASGALQDMARNADEVLSAGKGYTKYVRVIGGTACSRCAVLAGTYSATETAFQRHVHCCCSTCPIEFQGKETSKVPGGFHEDPEAYFESLSAADQDRVFTKAGAEAIRQGADVAKVVNARRSAYGIGYTGHSRTLGGVKVPITASRGRLTPLTIGRKADGSPLQVYATKVTARSQFFKSEQSRVDAAAAAGTYTRTISVRLMPEQLAIMANGSPSRWVELLTKYGYLA